MLKAVWLPAKVLDSWWAICPFSGSLLNKNKKYEKKPAKLHTKVIQALHYNDFPYELEALEFVAKNNVKPVQLQFIQTIHKRLDFIGNNRFYISRLYASIRQPVFENSTEAFDCLSLLPEQMHTNKCLQRTLSVSKTSKSFFNSGVLFIGAQIPTASMHAWIIEDNRQPDRRDRFWVNYTPLLAIYNDN